MIKENRYGCRFFLHIMFLILGTQTGIWAVLLVDLVRDIGISSSELGMSLTLQSMAGILGIYIGGKLVDRFQRKLILFLGFAGTGVFFCALAYVDHLYTMLMMFVIGGIFISFYDLIANTLGGDYESKYNQPILISLHACFSAGAAIGSITSGIMLHNNIPYHLIYIFIGIILFCMSFISLFIKIDTVRSVNDVFMTKDEMEEAKNKSMFTIIILFSSIFIMLTYFIDSALEGFLSLYLRETLDFTSILGGGAIAALHIASLIGLLISSILSIKIEQKKLLQYCGILSTLGLLMLIMINSPIFSILGLFFVGISLAPITPIAFSMAAKVSHKRRGQAISIVTIAGYVSFIIAPILIGTVGEVFSLEASFVILLICSISIVFSSFILHVNKATNGH